MKEPEFRSYYGLPVLNRPVWESPAIPGYLFLGGLAGAGAAIGLAAQVTGRPALSRVSKTASAAAGNLSIVALVGDLGVPRRMLNMLRVFKLTSPMSVGSWLLAAFVPTATVAAACEVAGAMPVLGALASGLSGVLGLPLATYTAALVSDTAVPAWHEGFEAMPYIFVSSAAASASGLGLLAAPVAETGPLVKLGAVAGIAEVAVGRLRERRIGVVGEAFHEGKARKLMLAAETLTIAGVLLAAASGASRARRGLAGAMLIAGSAFTRFGVFEAGLNSANDPRYTVVPQRDRLSSRTG